MEDYQSSFNDELHPSLRSGFERLFWAIEQLFWGIFAVAAILLWVGFGALLFEIPDEVGTVVILLFFILILTRFFKNKKDRLFYVGMIISFFLVSGLIFLMQYESRNDPETPFGRLYRLNHPDEFVVKKVIQIREENPRPLPKYIPLDAELEFVKTPEIYKSDDQIPVIIAYKDRQPGIEYIAPYSQEIFHKAEYKLGNTIACSLNQNPWDESHDGTHTVFISCDKDFDEPIKLYVHYNNKVISVTYVPQGQGLLAQGR